jgi:hypothetical protein
MNILKDSGWYIIEGNFEDGKFGINEGCDFVRKNCFQYWKRNKENKYFCFKKLDDCWLFKYDKALPEPFRYFNDPTVGGYPSMDYCPIKKEYWK